MTLDKTNCYETLTATYKKDVQYLACEKNHWRGCNCWLCRWRKYKELYKTKRGRPYDWKTFMIYDLMHDVKFCYLVERNKVIKREINNRIEWGYELKDYFQARYLRKTKRILHEIPVFDINPKFDLQKYAEQNLGRYVSMNRFAKDSFLELNNEIEYAIQREAQPPESRKVGRPSTQGFKCLQEIANFIYSHPDKKRTRREISRKHSVYKDFLDEAEPFLNKNYRIFKKKEGKSTVYYGNMADSRGLYWKVGV